uniref:Lipocalin n=1 Tax=Rhipicephalus appendiculatus TaxID=34631 RepID=A0A131YSA9_RHIAP
MTKQAYAALALAAVFNVYSGQNFNVSFETYNVTRFMSGIEPIWTYNTTEHATYKCKVDTIEETTKTYVHFNRSYHSANKSWETTLLTGTFQNPNLMAVGGRDSMADHTETLEFASKTYQCGVFYVRYLHGSGGWRDLRFKDTNGTSKPEKECMKYFRTMPNSTRVFYKFCKQFT